MASIGDAKELKASSGSGDNGSIFQASFSHSSDYHVCSVKEGT